MKELEKSLVLNGTRKASRSEENFLLSVAEEREVFGKLFSIEYQPKWRSGKSQAPDRMHN